MHIRSLRAAVIKLLGDYFQEKLKTDIEHLKNQMELREEAKVTCEKTANHAEVRVTGYVAHCACV